MKIQTSLNPVFASGRRLFTLTLLSEYLVNRVIKSSDSDGQT